ncbi:MAG: hypothetical protein R2764_09955 [Bacteroidales bacterium]
MLKKTTSHILFLLVLCLAISYNSFGQENIVNDSLQGNRKKERENKVAKEAFNLKPRFRINTSGVYSFPDTYIRFDRPDNILGSKISLEDNLGLADSKSFATSSLIYRITRSSGIYASYYGLNRNAACVAEKDMPYLDGWISGGEEINTYFYSQVLSLGYLYSILPDHDAFLGAYISVYFLTMRTGVNSHQSMLDEDIELIAPLPNVGLILDFRIYKWFGLYANMGAFGINSDPFSGKLYNFNLDLTFTATRWLEFSGDIAHSMFRLITRSKIIILRLVITFAARH